MNLTSWRTTVLGGAVFLGALARFVSALFDGDASTVPDFDAVLAAGAGLGLMFARDNGVTSEQAGAGK